MDPNNPNNNTPAQPAVPVVPPASPVIPGSVPNIPIPFKKPHNFLKIFIIIFVVFLILSVGATGAAAAIAYQKVKINNPAIEKPITQFFLSLPFTPKTPKYILERAALAHAKVSKHSFDISLAAKSEDLTSTLGLSQIDVAVKGGVDYSDQKNLKTSFNLSVTKDFNADLRKNDSFIYLKVNKLPDYILSMLKIDKKKLEPVLENWLGYDAKPLDTPARKALDETSPQKSVTKEYVMSSIDDLLDEKLLPAIVIRKEKLGENPTYKLDLVTSDKVIDSLVYRVRDRMSGGNNEQKISFDESKPSDYIKDLAMNVWVDESSFLVRKIVTTFKLKPNYGSATTGSKVLGASTFPGEPGVLGIESTLNPLGKAEYAIAAVVIFDDFGKEVEVKTPEKFLKPEEYYKKVMEASDMLSVYASSSAELTKRARDAARLTDLASLQQAINVAVQESESPTIDVLCKGSSKSGVCSGSSLSLSNNSDGSGWLKVDLKKQKAVAVQILPLDPVNNQIHHYSYCANADRWEIDTVLESDQYRIKMKTDGGNDDNKYEVGSDLGLIDKVEGCRY